MDDNNNFCKEFNMNVYEEKARKLKAGGLLCSNAVFDTFKSELNLEGKPPAPRSIDGKCGALLTTEFILKNFGRNDLIEDYNSLFISKFGSDKCIELMRKDRRCNDYVGESAKYISELFNK